MLSSPKADSLIIAPGSYEEATDPRELAKIKRIEEQFKRMEEREAKKREKKRKRKSSELTDKKEAIQATSNGEGDLNDQTSASHQLEMSEVRPLLIRPIPLKPLFIGTCPINPLYSGCV